MSGFYWQLARDNVLTAAGLRMLQIAAKYDGQDFDAVKNKIDGEYEQASGRAGSERHGGNFQTWIQVAREAGVMYVDEANKVRMTDAGRQALTLLVVLPDFLKAAPHFVIDLFSRFQLNNPARPRDVRGEDIAAQTKTSDVFPYWTIWKIMRSCGNYLTSEEIRRFLLRLHDSADIDQTIRDIKSFRRDRGAGMSEADLNTKYPPELTGAVGETKYVMGRAGAQVGKYQPLIDKPTADRFQLNPAYFPFIDAVLADKEQFKDHLTEESWMKEYGRPVALPAEDLVFDEGEEGPEEEIERLPEDDPVMKQVRALLEEGALNFLLSGAPGTSKSWYARRIAYTLTDGDRNRVKLVQFHPSFGYEDFVEGYVPQERPDGPPGFELAPKILKKVVALAKATEERVVLLIDEFTRGDAGRIFGEALTYIEPGYRDHIFTLASGKPFGIPKNLIVIATSNPYDRSVTDIDAAMQRRFEVIPLKPSTRLLREILTRNGMDPALIDNVVTWFQAAQKRLPFGGLGQTAFLRAKDGAGLERAWRYKIEPTIEPVLRHLADLLKELKKSYPVSIPDEEDGA